MSDSTVMAPGEYMLSVRGNVDRYTFTDHYCTPIVTLHMDNGRVEFGPGFTCDLAARESAELFWRTFMAYLDGRRDVYVVTSCGMYAKTFATRQEAEAYIRTEYGDVGGTKVVQQRV